MARAKSRFRKGSTPRTPSAPVRRDLDTLIQGISQQPPHLRTPGQGGRQINGWSSPVEGLSKRNCMRLQAKVSDKALKDFYLELMDVQIGERYSCLLTKEGSDTQLALRNKDKYPNIDLHGTGLTLDADRNIIGDSTSYIHASANDYYKKYVLINSGPIGLLLNRNKKTRMSTAKTTKQEGEGIVFIRAVAYNVTYTVSIDDVEVGSFKTPKADADDNEISTSIVAEKLTDEINKTDGYTAVRKRYVIHVTKDDKTKFKLEIDDGRSGELANAFTEKVESLSELPIIAPDEYLVELEGDPTTKLDNRWLKFDTFSDGVNKDFSQGTWKETVKPDIKYKIDVDTMPLVIYRMEENVIFVGPADGAVRKQTIDGTEYEFTFPQWGDRTSGDERSSPDPEFIGQKIRDHTIFRGRYVVCAGETLQFSETDDIFNFFNDTSAATLATDTFGLRSNSERSSPLEWMIPVEDSILLFSSTAQFQVRAADSDVLTPLSAEIFRLSNIDMNSNVRPKLSGSQVLFATQHFGYSHFREFNYYNNTRNTKIGLNLGSSLDITNYVPKYIEGYVTHWDVGQAADCAVAISPTDNKCLYVYKYLWQTSEQGQRKVQKSWSKWEFNQNVRWVKFIENALYLLVTDQDGTYFCIQLNDEIEVRDEPQIYLDRLIQYPASPIAYPSAQVTGTYDATTNTTTFTIPYKPRWKTIGIVRFVNDDKQGLKLGETKTGTLVCKEKGDWTKYKLAFGEPYLFDYEFNTGYAPDNNEEGSRRIGQLAGRTQIMRWTVNHVDTGFYKIRVKRLNRSDDTVKSFRARKLNVSNNKISYSDDWLENGSMEVPVCSKNDQCRISVESYSWLPITVTSASWQGLYSDRENPI